MTQATHITQPHTTFTTQTTTQITDRIITLPTGKSKIKTDLSELIVFIYGPRKFGKTTWCSEADNALFLATEPGLAARAVSQIEIKFWEDFYQVYNLLAAGNHQFRTVVIDTADNAYKLCEEYICRVNGVNSIQDIGWGRGPKYAVEQFHRLLLQFAFLPYGLYLTSHSTTETIETRVGKITRTVPSLPTGKDGKEGPRDVVTKLADFILFGDFYSQETPEGPQEVRIIRTVTGRDYEAGSRYPLPPILGLDYSVFLAEFHKAARWLEERESVKAGDVKTA